MSSRTALLLGGTGLVGRNCLSFLLEDDFYQRVVVLGRRPLDVSHSKLEHHIVDFERLETYSDLLNVDDIFCCLGSTIRKAGSQSLFSRIDFTYPYLIAKLALRQGASQFFIISSVGASHQSNNFYLGVKGQIENALMIMSYRAVHIFRPSLIGGKRGEFRFGERIAQEILSCFAFLLVGQLRKFKPIDAQVLSQAMIEAAREDLSGVHIHEYDKIIQLANRSRPLKFDRSGLS